MADLPERSGVVQAGSVFSTETLAELGAINLAELPDRPAERVLVVDRDDQPASTAILDRLRELGVDPDHVALAGTDLFLDHPTEYATVPGEIVDEISNWVGPSEISNDTPDAPTRRTSATIAWQGGTVEEEVVALGPVGFVGILTRPSSGVPRGTVVWLEFGLGAPCRAGSGLGRVRPDVGTVGLRLRPRGLLGVG